MIPHVFVVGDSISIQYGPHLARAIGGKFRYARKTGREAEIAGNERIAVEHGGDSSMVLEYLQAVLGESVNPDVLLLNCGLHDIKTDPACGARQVEPDAYRENLRRIVALVGEQKVRLIWVRTTPADENVHNRPDSVVHRFATDVDAYNAIADEVMTGAGVGEVDLFAFTRSLGGAELFCDHVHFTDEVRALQGAYIAGYLEAAVAPPTP